MSESEVDKSNLGAKLSVLAHMKGLSQSEIANRCQVSRITINRFFRGRSELRAYDLVRLLRELDIDVERVVEDSLQNQLKKIS